MAEKLGEKLKQAIMGAQHEEIIKSGTLVVTRGIGIVAVALVGTFFLLDQLGEGPWAPLNTQQKLQFLLGAGAIWAVVAAADAVARGIASTGPSSRVLTLPAGLKAKRTVGSDDPGWSVVAMRTSASEDGPTAYLLMKPGEVAVWEEASHISFT